MNEKDKREELERAGVIRKGERIIGNVTRRATIPPKPKGATDIISTRIDGRERIAYRDRFVR